MPDHQESSTFFGLMRHGQTVWNREKRLQGRQDSPLTDQGREDLRRWGDVLRRQGWQRVFASDLGRVKDTVAELALGLPVTFSQSLREQDWGEWEGLTLHEVEANWHAALHSEAEKGWDFRPPGGESRRSVRDRVIAELLAIHHRHPDERVLVVCHLGIIKCLLYHIAGRQFLPGEPKMVKKSCMHEVVCTNSTFMINRLNIEPTPMEAG